MDSTPCKAGGSGSSRTRAPGGHRLGFARTEHIVCDQCKGTHTPEMSATAVSPLLCIRASPAPRPLVSVSWHFPLACCTENVKIREMSLRSFLPPVSTFAGKSQMAPPVETLLPQAPPACLLLILLLSSGAAQSATVQTCLRGSHALRCSDSPSSLPPFLPLSQEANVWAPSLG